MDAVLRATLMYILLLLLFRVMGKRTLATMTTFDFVLILVVGQATQQALLGQDFSFAMAILVILTLIGLDRISDYLGYRFPKFDKLIESIPVLLVENGELMRDRMAKTHISEDDILTAARQTQGLESMAQIKYAVLEKDGGVSIVPKAEHEEMP